MALLACLPVLILLLQADDLLGRLAIQAVQVLLHFGVVGFALARDLVKLSDLSRVSRLLLSLLLSERFVFQIQDLFLRHNFSGSLPLRIVELAIRLLQVGCVLLLMEQVCWKLLKSIHGVTWIFSQRVERQVLPVSLGDICQSCTTLRDVIECSLL